MFAEERRSSSGCAGHYGLTATYGVLRETHYDEERSLKMKIIFRDPRKSKSVWFSQQAERGNSHDEFLPLHRLHASNLPEFERLRSRAKARFQSA